jgi:HemY protein
MRRFMMLLLILIVSVLLGLKIAEDPGYAFFSYQHWSVEMPLWFAILALIFLFLASYFLLRLFDSIDFSLYRWKMWLRWRRKHKSYSKTNRGLVELIEGDWKNAEYYLMEGIPQSDAPLINYLAAATAAHERGAYDKRDTYLRKAHDFVPHAEIAIGLTQAQLQFKQGQLEQTLATLRHLHRIAPKNKIVLKLLERVYVHLSDWQDLLELLPSLRKAKLITDEQLQIFEKKIYREQLISAVKNQDANKLRAIWNAMPRALQKDPELIGCYAEQMSSFSETATEINALLLKAIKKTWNSDLVKLYGLIVIPGTAKQLTTAEGWLKEHPQDPVLLLTLGRLSVRCQLWGKARDYYAHSLKITAAPDASAEYGQLLEQLGEQNAAVQVYRQGLLCVI